MAFKKQIRLAGSGGQGLVLAGIILAEAAILYEDLNAVQTQSYGPEARGGASKSEVIISDGDIDYPKCQGVDIMLALTQKSIEAYLSDLDKRGLLVVDEDLVDEMPANGGRDIYRVPFTKIAQEKIGKSFVANIVALGALSELLGFITPASMEKAVLRRVPKGTEEINKKALNAGREAIRKILAEQKQE
jgi:2-oxoglutarate ferredoxin oxidoreductase subunit gamma